jgi:hypothetical protein
MRSRARQYSEPWSGSCWSAQFAASQPGRCDVFEPLIRYCGSSWIEPGVASIAS